MKETKPAMPMAHKFILGIAVIVIPAILLLGLYLSAVERRWAEAEVTRELQEAVISDGKRMSDHLSKLWDDLAPILHQESATPEEIEQAVLDEARYNKDFTVIGAAKVDGTVFSSSSGHRGANIAHLHWFGSALSRAIVVKSYAIFQPAAANDDRISIVLAAPLKNKDRMTVAVVFAVVGLDRLAAFLSNSTGWPRTSVLLANDGSEIMKWQVLRPASLHADEAGRLPDKIGELSGKRGEQEAFMATERDISGGAFHTGWTLMTKLPKMEALAGLEPALQRIWIACLAVAFFILLASTLWARWLSAPLQDISAFAAGLADGAAVKPILQDRYREASSLSASLTCLWTRLQKPSKPLTVELVSEERDVEGSSALVFNDLIEHLNALIEEETGSLSKAEPGWDGLTAGRDGRRTVQ